MIASFKINTFELISGIKAVEFGDVDGLNEYGDRSIIVTATWDTAREIVRRGNSGPHLNLNTLPLLELTFDSGNTFHNFIKSARFLNVEVRPGDKSKSVDAQVELVVFPYFYKFNSNRTDILLPSSSYERLVFSCTGVYSVGFCYSMASSMGTVGLSGTDLTYDLSVSQYWSYSKGGFVSIGFASIVTINTANTTLELFVDGKRRRVLTIGPTGSYFISMGEINSGEKGEFSTMQLRIKASASITWAHACHYLPPYFFSVATSTNGVIDLRNLNFTSAFFVDGNPFMFRNSGYQQANVLRYYPSGSYDFYDATLYPG
jgi:hypothetical protein